MRYQGKSVIITGAAGGMGKQFALDFAAEGADVVAVDLVEEGLNTLEEAAKELPGSITAYVGDLSTQEANEGMIDFTVEKFGKLDVLVNNAGVGGRFEPIGELTNELWEKVFKVNLQAPIYSTRKAVQVMAKQAGGGNIINMSSVCGLQGAKSGVAYTITKHGLIGLTKNTAFMYMDQNIRCNAIAPGWIQTEMVEDFPDDSVFGKAKIQGSYGKHLKLGKPEDVSSLIRFVASDEGKFINGSVLLIDGGLLSC